MLCDKKDLKIYHKGSGESFSLFSYLPVSGRTVVVVVGRAVVVGCGVPGRPVVVVILAVLLVVSGTSLRVNPESGPSVVCE